MTTFLIAVIIVTIVPMGFLVHREHMALKFAAKRNVLGSNEVAVLYKGWKVFFSRYLRRTPDFMYSKKKDVARNVVNSTFCIFISVASQIFMYFDLIRSNIISSGDGLSFGFGLSSNLDTFTLVFYVGLLVSVIVFGFEFTSNLRRDINNVVDPFAGTGNSLGPYSVTSLSSVERAAVTEKKPFQTTKILLDSGTTELYVHEKEQAISFMKEIGLLKKDGSPDFHERNSRKTRHMTIDQLKEGSS